MLMGIADATVLPAAGMSSTGGDGDMSEGEAIDAGNMKSSKFMESA